MSWKGLAHFGGWIVLNLACPRDRHIVVLLQKLAEEISRRAVTGGRLELTVASRTVRLHCV